MTRITIVGAGNVGRALGRGFSGLADTVVRHAVRDVDDPKHDGLAVVALPNAGADADLVVLAVPSGSLADVVPELDLRAGTVVVDATNAVRVPPPDGFDSVGNYVRTLLPEGVALVKAFNTVGAEFLHSGAVGAERHVFLPMAGDREALDVVAPLAESLGYDVAELGDADAIPLVEAHARLWIHLAFAVGWGRNFAFTVEHS